MWAALMSRSRSAGIASSWGDPGRVGRVEGSSAAVIARGDRPGDKRLVGYVTGGRHRHDRTQLAERLPACMIPAAVVSLDVRSC